MSGKMGFDLEIWYDGWKTVAEEEATCLSLPMNADGSIDKYSMDPDTRDRYVRMETVAEVLNSLAVHGIVLSVDNEAQANETSI